MRIKIIATGIYGTRGELPIGSELDVSEEPTGWAGRYVVITQEPQAPLTADTAPVMPSMPVPEAPKGRK